MLVRNQSPAQDAYRLINSSTIDALINAGQYGQISELIEQAIQLEGASSMDNMLLATYQLCLACEMLQKTAKWHFGVYEEAERQKQAIVEHLHSIANILHADSDNSSESSTQSDLSSNSVKLSDVLCDTNRNDSRSNLGLWQRVRNVVSGQLVTSQSTGSAAQFELALLPMPQECESSPTVKLVTDRRNDNSVDVTSTDSETEKGPASLVIYGIGQFRMYYNGQLIKNWPNCKGKSLFKYLLLQRERPVAKEVLMELFWPDSSVDAARNNLNVTIYNLRQALRSLDASFSYIVFQDDCYRLNHTLQVWIDFEAFRELFKRGQQLFRENKHAEALIEFRSAELLYQGELFEEDRYDDWIIPERQVMCNQYIEILDHLTRHALDQEDYTACIAMCHKQLAIDSCREDAHRLLMRCYIAQGQDYLAVRQYHRCTEELKEQLDIAPGLDTVALYEQIRAEIH